MLRLLIMLGYREIEDPVFSGTGIRDEQRMGEDRGRTCPQRSRHARHREAQPRRTGLRGGRGAEGLIKEGYPG